MYYCYTFQNFVSDFSAIVTDPTTLSNNGEKRNLVNSVVCEHFLRQGMLDIAEDLIKVSSTNLNQCTIKKCLDAIVIVFEGKKVKEE